MRSARAWAWPHELLVRAVPAAVSQQSAGSQRPEPVPVSSRAQPARVQVWEPVRLRPVVSLSDGCCLADEWPRPNNAHCRDRRSVLRQPGHGPQLIHQRVGSGQMSGTACPTLLRRPARCSRDRAGPAPKRCALQVCRLQTDRIRPDPSNRSALEWQPPGGPGLKS